MTKKECCEMALQELQHIERGEAKLLSCGSAKDLCLTHTTPSPLLSSPQVVGGDDEGEGNGEVLNWKSRRWQHFARPPQGKYDGSTLESLHKTTQLGFFPYSH